MECRVPVWTVRNHIPINYNFGEIADACRLWNNRHSDNIHCLFSDDGRLRDGRGSITQERGIPH